MVFVTYSLAYLDRANYGFQLPGMLAARLLSARRLVFAALNLWSALAAIPERVSREAAGEAFAMA